MKVLVILALACFASSSAEDVREIIPGTNIGLIKLNTSKTRAGIEYYVSDTPQPYQAAFNYCNSSRRKLAIIKTDVQQTDIEVALLDKEHIVKGNIWLNSYCYNGAWYWGDASPVVFNKLPNGRTDCYEPSQGIMMFGTQNFQPLLFTWAGEGKSEANYFICQSP